MPTRLQSQLFADPDHARMLLAQLASCQSQLNALDEHREALGPLCKAAGASWADIGLAVGLTAEGARVHWQSPTWRKARKH